MNRTKFNRANISLVIISLEFEFAWHVLAQQRGKSIKPLCFLDTKILRRKYVELVLKWNHFDEMFPRRK